MLKFAVVHAPVGPQKGPGLYEPDHLSGIEEAHQFVGEETYARSYDKEAPKDRSRGRSDPKGKKRNKEKSGVVVEKKAPRRASVGIDFDGTITLDPRGFKKAIDKAVAAGIECHLITGRSETERPHVEAFCKRYDMKFSSMSFYPVPYKYGWAGWDALMDVRIGSWKANRIAEMEVGMFIDDSAIHTKQIVKANPDILVLKAVEAK